MKEHKRYTEEDKERAVELYKSGSTFKQLEEAIGCGQSTIYYWLKSAGVLKSVRRKNPALASSPQPLNGSINPLLAKMANGNDLTPFIGKEITKMQPREIWAFLKAINCEGKLTSTQVIEI